MLLAACSARFWSASASLAREIRTGTALAVLSKPVGRRILLAKYAGLICAGAADYVNLVAGFAGQPNGLRCLRLEPICSRRNFCVIAGNAYMMGGFS